MKTFALAFKDDKTGLDIDVKLSIPESHTQEMRDRPIIPKEMIPAVVDQIGNLAHAVMNYADAIKGMAEVESHGMVAIRSFFATLSAEKRNAFGDAFIGFMNTLSPAEQGIAMAIANDIVPPLPSEPKTDEATN